MNTRETRSLVRFISLSSLAKLGLLVAFVLFYAHFAMIARYAIDVPNWDEWSIVTPEQFNSLSLSWLIAPHNEHRIVWAKLWVWLLYKYNGWNIATAQKLNFILYGGLLLTILVGLYNQVSKDAFYIGAIFIPFLLSTTNYENHLWSFQISFHIYLLFFLMGTFLLFNIKQSTRSLVVGAGLLLSSMFSLASGVVSSLVVASLFCLFKLSRGLYISDKVKFSRREFAQLLIVLSIIGAGAFLFLMGFKKHPGHPPLVMPWKTAFYRYFLNLLSFGFGWDMVSLIPGYICLLVVITPMIGLARRLFNSRKDTSGSRQTSAEFTSIAIVLGILASEAVICMARAGFGTAQAKSSRYSEIVMILVPFTAVNWHLWLQKGTRLKETHNEISQRLTKNTLEWQNKTSRFAGRSSVVISLLWVLTCVAFRNNWSIDQYKINNQVQISGLNCIYKYYDSNTPAICPMIFPADISTKLELAKELNLSFYRTYKNETALKQ